MLGEAALAHGRNLPPALQYKVAGAPGTSAADAADVAEALPSEPDAPTTNKVTGGAPGAGAADATDVAETLPSEPHSSEREETFPGATAPGSPERQQSEDAPVFEKPLSTAAQTSETVEEERARNADPHSQ